MNIHESLTCIYSSWCDYFFCAKCASSYCLYRVYLLQYMYVHAPHESALQSSEIMSIKVCSFSCYTMQKHGGIKFKKFITPPTLRRDECPVSL